jgi:hypothetical protein
LADDDDEEHDHEAEPASANGDPASPGAPSAPEILDLRRVELGVVPEVGMPERQPASSTRSIITIW